MTEALALCSGTTSLSLTLKNDPKQLYLSQALHSNQFRMSFQRVGLRFAQQLRSPAFRPALRSTLQRRFASAPTPPGQGASKLVGTADNAFNRERAAVKAHAAATSDLWRRLSIYVVIPCLILGSINAWNLWNEHWEHWEHLPPLEERVEYPYQNIRMKNFFWGDGDKTLFWNEKTNYHNKDKQT